LINERIESIREILNPAQAALITSGINRRFMTGFASSAGTVIITKKEAVLLIDFRYFENAKKNIKDLKVILCEKLYEQTAELLKKMNIRSLFIEVDNISISGLASLRKNLPDFDIMEDDALSHKIRSLRCIKCQEEIDFIKKAQAITDKAFLHILNYIKAGRTEREIALELEFFMRKNGSEGIAFDTIAVSGKNSSLPHGVPTDKPLEYGDFLTMDYGAVYAGYRSDMTRTVALGYVTEEQQSVYDTVLKAQNAALNNIAPEKSCKDIDASARNIISSAGYGKCFGHGLGHSVGLEIHESPAFNTRDETILKPGMIMTVEPGIYIENKFGVRIEDMVVITDQSFENLTASPKSLIVLK
jgi:Xaa-Pro aminopeptidase